MSTSWAPKRFWTAASAQACDGGFTVHLDARQVKTPAKTPVIVPSLALAQALAAEWDAQTGKVKPETMPLTLIANSALDTVSVQFDAVAGMIAAYGASDLLCYRATAPQELIARQAAAWDPLLDWAAQALGAALLTTPGVMPIAQPQAATDALTRRVHGFSPFELAAFHDLVSISGSLVLGIAVADGHLSVDEAWTCSRIDESWQAQMWGVDDMAAANAVRRQTALGNAGRFLALCRSQSA